ncbi:phage tape measure protein [Roseibium sp. TrichSKD4]|uniref:tape measure protein n=1 Tax=Roseibium sp. TrichSKD4 TaxID=744980 RepID=UPI0001E56B90|nr:tape measure protein [Roseibium sp. TrichSKD4]EFO32621.1 phage tape measure protein [Roseibium sp. TrichSKD4]
MATDLERLVVQLSADVKKFEKAMNKAQGITSKSMKAVETRVKRTEGRLSKFGRESFVAIRAGTAAFAAVGVAAGGAAVAFKRFSDAATRIDNTLKVAGLEGEQLETVYKSLRDSAIKYQAPLETLATLYGSLSLAQKELGVSSTEIVSFTDNVAAALKVSGKTAQEASGALLQLGQALGGGVVRAEEFNSILEGAPAIAQAAARGIKEAGGSVSKLRGLVIDGKVSSEAFFRGFEAGAVTLDERLSQTTVTIDQAFSNLGTALTDSVREFNKATGASENFATGIDSVAKAINDIDFEAFISNIQEAYRAVEKTLNAILNEALGVTEGGVAINLEKEEAETDIRHLEREVRLLEDSIERNKTLGFDNTLALQRLADVKEELQAIRALAATMPDLATGFGSDGKLLPNVPVYKSGRGAAGEVSVPFPTITKADGATNGPVPRTKPKQVSLDDFDPPAKRGSGRGRKRESDYEQETRSIRERIAALQAEHEAQAAVNPLLDDYGHASTRASAAHELLTSAQRSGLAAGKELQNVQQLLSGNFDGLSPKAREQAVAMLELANSYASASSNVEQLRDKQEQARQTAEGLKSSAKNILGGFVSDLRQGKSAAEALANALDKVLDKLLDMALNAVFDGFGASASGGGFGSFLGFSRGGVVPHDGRVLHAATGGHVTGPGSGTSDSIPARLSNGEYVVNAAATAKHRQLLDAINSGASIPGFAKGGPVGGIYLPKPGSSGGGKSVPVQVNVINNANASVRKEERKTAGGKTIDVIVDELTGQNSSRPGTATYRALQSRSSHAGVASR